jgi:hypothetical protein
LKNYLEVCGLGREPPKYSISLARDFNKKTWTRFFQQDAAVFCTILCLLNGEPGYRHAAPALFCPLDSLERLRFSASQITRFSPDKFILSATYVPSSDAQTPSEA